MSKMYIIKIYYISKSSFHWISWRNPNRGFLYPNGEDLSNWGYFLLIHLLNPDAMPILLPAPVLSIDTGDEGGQAGHVARGAL